MVKKLPDEDSLVNTDEEKVNSILANLIKNAIKFTNDGFIEFGCEIVDGCIRFFVKDSGIGIPEYNKELIFERFRQGNESISRAHEGCGLGLSIAKKYVMMLGGRIWFDSEVGNGSTFYFTIPYSGKSELKTALKDEVVKNENITQDKKLKILIAEDDDVSYSLIIRMVKEISSNIIHASNGEEAVQFCRDNSDIDLILMDIRMPYMDGIDATKNIRLFNDKVIIIAQTAYGFSSDQEKALAAGCNDYLSKPLNKKVLLDLINKYFRVFN